MTSPKSQHKSPPSLRSKKKVKKVKGWYRPFGDYVLFTNDWPEVKVWKYYGCKPILKATLHIELP